MSKSKIHLCVIVDDEPLSRQVIEKYIEQSPELELSGSFGKVQTALQTLSNTPVDLLFLDIKMPDMNGFEFIENLTVRPKIILITAYSEFALQGFDYGVDDYLLKPVSFERFQKSIDKILSSLKESERLAPESFLYVKSGYNQLKIDLNQLEVLEAFGNFTKLHLNDQVILASESLSSLSERLPGEFLRIHKSYVIHLNKIQIMGPKSVRIGSHEIPIGNTYKKDFSDKFQR